MRSLSTELIRHKRITTTEAKAREASRFVEGLITRAKKAYLGEKEGGELNLHARRNVGKIIQDRAVLRELFSEVASKVAERPGGYTRVVRIGRRNGDGAEMAVLELVDYNLDRDESAARSRTTKTISREERVRRSRQKQAEKAAGAGETASEETAAVEETDEATAEEKLENLEKPSSGGGSGTVPSDETDVTPQDEPVDAAPGYDNVSQEVASDEGPAEPLAEQQSAEEIKKPAPEAGEEGGDDKGGES